MMIGHDQVSGKNTLGNVSLEIRNLFVSITDYPNFIREQGGTDEVQYGSEIPTVAAATDVELLLYKTETNYPNTEGHLIRVWYEISFQIKAANDSATVTYQLQAKDRGGSWVDMCAAVPCAELGTSYVTKLIKGYMDIQSGASKLPFEMRLIFQSDESDTDLLVSFTCTWGSQAPGGSGSCYSVKQAGDNLYASFNDTIYYQTGDDSWVACTGSMEQVRCFCYSDVAVEDTFILYAVTNTTVKKKHATTQVWSAIGSSPDNAYSIVEFGGNLYVGLNAGTVKKSTDGASFATDTGLSGHGAVRALIVFNSLLYAGCADGTVHVWDGASTWTEVGAGELSSLSITEIYCLGVHDSRLYAAGLGADVAIMGTDADSWATTGGLAGNASRVFALISFLQTGEPAAVFYAATGNGADVDYLDNGTWTNTGELSGDYQALCLGVYTDNNTIYAGSNNWAKIWKASITATWESGEATGKMKNDKAGQETKFEIVGRILE